MTSVQSNLYTTKQAAGLLALHEGHIRRLAIALDIGTKYGQRQRLFTDEDIEQLRQRNQQVGRPKNVQQDPPVGRGKEWNNRRLFEREGNLYVVAQHDSGDVAVWESTDNGKNWHAPSEATMLELLD
jgi:hypothetical protein